MINITSNWLFQHTLKIKRNIWDQNIPFLSDFLTNRFMANHYISLLKKVS